MSLKFNTQFKNFAYPVEKCSSKHNAKELGTVPTIAHQRYHQAISSNQYLIAIAAVPQSVTDYGAQLE